MASQRSRLIGVGRPFTFSASLPSLHCIPPTSCIFQHKLTRRTAAVNESASRRRYASLSTPSNSTAPVPTAMPKGFWNSVSNHKKFLIRVGEELGIKKLSDWYAVSREEVQVRGGGRLFIHYSSLEDALRAAYPEYDWDPLRFRTLKRKKSTLATRREEWLQDKEGEGEGGASVVTVERKAPGYWNDKTNVFAAIERAEEKLGIAKPEDWYTVTLADLYETGFPRVVTKPRLAELLQEKYPGHPWEKLYLLKGRFGQQKRLEKAVESLFPGEEININARKEAELYNPMTGQHLELDVYIPSLNLAFEYQEKHHYTGSQYAYQPLSAITGRDETKKVLAKAKGITLIIVPCWWDGSTESLVATIKKERPELLPNMDAGRAAQPIPEEMPPDFMEKNTTNVEGVGQPTTACFFTMSNIDPASWWMFEKYDGVRGFWNPSKRAFFSRHGNRFSMPDDVIESMPTDMFLDGELWFGTDNFQEAMKISHRMEAFKIDWTKFKYMIYDNPTHTGNYAERYASLEERLGGQTYKYLEIAPREICKDMSHLEQFFQDIMDRGGEGIILRDPDAPYQPGRSLGYLKHKKFRDAEALVIGSAGTHQWECELPNGVRFVASPGTTECVKRWNPEKGDIVSFKHHGFLADSRKPKLPTIYRMRPDLTWDLVVKNWKDQISIPSVTPLKKMESKNKPKGYWRDIENRRKFFEEYAAEIGFNPTIAANWREVNIHQIVDKKGGGLLNRYNGSLKMALQDTFGFVL